MAEAERSVAFYACLMFTAYLKNILVDYYCENSDL